MKKLFLIFIIIPVIGCQTNQKPDKETVLKRINDDLNFPRTIDYEIFCSDPDGTKLEPINRGFKAFGRYTGCLTN
ncbi:hypothetical protein [Zunongwangia pacifica]|uniref:Uncharacterized protein n=1 Tax=Zunongwangia pacifica TaxID=2911062 RepID=A0A9X1ZS79_9FLAO|nr:hypothetical protein [Zunongwangia pacifica]MCL6218964.1 hypothetical protein [Zunongwangia pacifica]